MHNNSPEQDLSEVSSHSVEVCVYAYEYAHVCSGVDYATCMLLMRSKRMYQNDTLIHCSICRLDGSPLWAVFAM